MSAKRLAKYPNMELILGPPGTGKTTELLKRIEAALAEGIPPDRIAFVSFTKKSTDEARQRAMDKFKFQAHELPWFRTLHSMAFRMLGLKRTDVMTKNHYQELGASLGLAIKGYVDPEDPDFQGTEKGDILLFVVGLHRARKRPLDVVYHQSDAEELFSFAELEQFARALAEFKQGRGLIDYSDMIDMFVSDVCEEAIPTFDLLLVDEAQDLSVAQWRMVRKLHERSSMVIMAGDDDQAIYRWSGASVETFLHLGEVAQWKTVLNVSYRLPRRVWQGANDLAAQIKDRYAKAWKPRPDGADGTTAIMPDIEHVAPFMESGQWLVLVRNNYMVAGITDWLRVKGLPYETRYWSTATCPELVAVRHWETLRKGQSLTAEQVRLVYRYLPAKRCVIPGFKTLKGLDDDKRYSMLDLQQQHGLITQEPWFAAMSDLQPRDVEYFRGLLRKGEDLKHAARIRVSSIHGVKGGEAENVVLNTDLSYRTWKASSLNMDDEHRVFYVGATRAKERLYVVEPKTNRYYSPMFERKLFVPK